MTDEKTQGVMRLLKLHYAKVELFMSKSVSHVIKKRKVPANVHSNSNVQDIMKHSRAKMLVAHCLQERMAKKEEKVQPTGYITISPEVITNYSTTCKAHAEKTITLDNLPPSTRVDSRQPVIVKKMHKGPFLKVEDLSGQYRPIVCELKEWPQIKFDDVPPASPFNYLRPTKEYRHESRNKDHQKFCELCNIQYRDVAKHLAGMRHQTYASNDNLFIGVDALIKKRPFRKYSKPSGQS